jgi:hypothetical protein
VSEEATVSLYLDLETGQVADIEVVARAALAFSAAIKVLAAELAPEADVRVELVSGTEGSLSLNSLIRGAGMFVTKERLQQVAIGIMTYFAMQVAENTSQDVINHIRGKDVPQAVQLSDADVQRIARAVQNETARKQAQQVYKEVERDPAIKGVGATDQPGHRPVVIVPRAEFHQHAGLVVREQTVTHRTVPERMTVVLVSPVLVEGNRRWKFRGPTGEFGAPIKDADFAARVLSGTTTVPMVAGIIMDVEVETVETLKDGVWVPEKNKTVTHVYGVKPPVTIEQASLFANAPGPDDDDDDD